MKRPSAVDNALRWIDSLIANQESGLADLKRRRQRFVDAVDKPDNFTSPIDVLSWTINDVQNIQRNYRLDLAPSLAARLSRALDREPS